MNQIPNTTVAGQVFTSTGQQSQGRWATQVNGVYISQTFAVYGAVPNDTFPGFFMPVPSGATVTLMEVQTVLTSGTVTVEVLQNGTGVGGLTALGVTSSASGWVDPSGTGAVSDGDFFTITTTSGSTPVSLTVSIVFMVSGIYTGPTSGGGGGGGGACGVSGVPGACGVSGVPGACGVSGVPGACGVAGVPGPTGPTGVTGACGVAGACGIAGACGVSGVSGTAGACGVSGVAGACGISGVAGTAGACGVSGVAGACGVSGVAGTAGACGVSGVAGACGVSGVSGVAGACGVSGVVGACGISGVSGVSGAGLLLAAATSASGAINTTETVLETLTVVAGSTLAVGTLVRIVLQGTCTATVADTSTFTVRAGTAGTTSDASVAAMTLTSGTSGTSVPFKIIIDLTVRTTGSAGTAAGSMEAINQGVTGLSTLATNVVPFTSSTLATTTATKLSITYKSSATTCTCTFQTATIEVL